LLALSHYNIGTIQLQNQQLEKALDSFEQSLDNRIALVAAHPSVTQFRENLGKSYRELALRLHQAGQDPKAFSLIQKSLDTLEGLVRSQPDQASYHSELGHSWNALGYLHDEAQDNARAIPAFQKAVAQQRLAVAKSEEGSEYKVSLSNHLDNLGEQYIDLGQVALGLPHYQAAIGLRRELSAAHPENRDYALNWVKALLALGSIQRHDGDSATARQSFTDARTILDRWSGAAPGDAALRVLLGAALDQEANTLFDQGLAKEAKQRLERALSLLRPGTDHATSDQDSVEERRWRSEALWDLARVLRAKKLVAEAAMADGERMALWKERPPNELADLALKQLERALVIGYGKTPVSDRARAVRELELAQAADNVRLAIVRG
jgi:tetratricopeptide (TPR) repeat protein